MPETPKQGSERAARVREALARHYGRARDGVRDGLLDTRAAKLEVPPRSEHARTFVFAVLLPFSLLRLTWRDEALKARFLRRMKPPFAMLFGMAILLALHVARLLPGPVDKVVGGVGNALKGTYEMAQDLPSPFAFFGAGDDDDKHDKHGKHGRRDESSKSREHAKGHSPGAAAREAAARAVVAKLHAGGAARDEDEDEDEAGAAEETAAASGEVSEALGEVALALTATGLVGDGGALKLTGDPGEVAAAAGGEWRAAEETKEWSNETGDRDEREKEREKQGDKDDAWDAIGFVGALLTLEWILVWVGREHHDAIAFDVSALAGIPADALARPPKLRCDPGYVVTKGWRALRFVLFVLLALPAAGFSALMLKISCTLLRASFLTPALTTGTLGLAGGLSALYWSAVFGAANAFVAWDPPPPGWAPWFMRGLTELGRAPFVGWIARVYARIVARATRKVWPACYAFELAPLESIAMTAGKLVAVVPGVYLVLRPFFGPAATHLILARRHVNAAASVAQVAADPGA